MQFPNAAKNTIIIINKNINSVTRAANISELWVDKEANSRIVRVLSSNKTQNERGFFVDINTETEVSSTRHFRYYTVHKQYKRSVNVNRKAIAGVDILRRMYKDERKKGN